MFYAELKAKRGHRVICPVGTLMDQVMVPCTYTPTGHDTYVVDGEMSAVFLFVPRDEVEKWETSDAQKWPKIRAQSTPDYAERSKILTRKQLKYAVKINLDNMGWSQTKLARIMGVTQPALCLALSEKRQGKPSYQFIKRIIAGLRTNENSFYELAYRAK